MTESLASIESSLHTVKAKLERKVCDLKAKLATARKELRQARTLRTLGNRRTKFVTKAVFLHAAIGLLTDNGGQLELDTLIGLTKLHLKEDGYSLSGVDMHAAGYLQGDPRFHVKDDGTVSLIEAERHSDE